MITDSLAARELELEDLDERRAGGGRREEWVRRNPARKLVEVNFLTIYLRVCTNLVHTADDLEALSAALARRHVTPYSQ